MAGEYTSSLVILVENAPQNRRAFNAIGGGWGATAGILLGSGVGALLTLGSIPLFHLIHTTDPMIIFMGEVGFSVAIGLIAGGLMTASVELIPAAIRCTGLAFAYNASIGWFGETTPLIAAWLITITATRSCRPTGSHWQERSHY